MFATGLRLRLKNQNWTRTRYVTSTGAREINGVVTESRGSRKRDVTASTIVSGVVPKFSVVNGRRALSDARRAVYRRSTTIIIADFDFWRTYCVVTFTRKTFDLRGRTLTFLIVRGKTQLCRIREIDIGFLFKKKSSERPFDAEVKGSIGCVECVSNKSHNHE